jgi:hypothetical protein
MEVNFLKAFNLVLYGFKFRFTLHDLVECLLELLSLHNNNEGREKIDSYDKRVFEVFEVSNILIIVGNRRILLKN